MPSSTAPELIMCLRLYVRTNFGRTGTSDPGTPAPTESKKPGVVRRIAVESGVLVAVVVFVVEIVSVVGMGF